MKTIASLLSMEIAGITIYQFILSFAILLATLTLRRVITRGIMRWLESRAERTKTKWDETLISSVRPPIEAMILAYGILLAIKVLPQPEEPVNIKRFVEMAGHVLILFIGAWLLLRMVTVVDIVLKRKAADPRHWLEYGMVPLISKSIRIMIAIVAGIVIAQNMGYSVSGLVASLGLGGAALALASKDTLSNLFGSMMILVDKPFKVGDWIVGDGFEGIVEEVGFRSTRIRTFEKTVQNIPNNILANMTVENIDRRRDAGLNVRRISMTVGVTYATTADQMEEAVKEIKEILKTDEGVSGDAPCLVSFTDFGDSSLNIFVYYFANKADWAYYLKVRQRVNLKIMRKLKELGLSVAFPSRSIYLEALPGGMERVHIPLPPPYTAPADKPPPPTKA
ncbi:MAG: mechanosensitive ion channel family protein [Candidatus Nitrospinota bacterium M3_3B_026]